MKKFIHRVQDLGKKAAELKQVVGSAPTKAAEIREAIVMSAGQLHQLRSEVQSSLQGLRANSEDRLLQAMREINDNTYTFEEAGYELAGLDLDLSLNQRLAVHLQKFEDVPHVKLRSLIAKETCETVKSILAGILKAEETAANVELTHLKHDSIVVHVGATPVVRMCWRSDTVIGQLESVAAAPQASTPPPPQSSSVFGSYFDRPPAPSAPTTSAPASSQRTGPVEVATIAPAQSVPSETAHAVSSSPWSREALDRFKKMPNLSKHSR